MHVVPNCSLERFPCEPCVTVDVLVELTSVMNVLIASVFNFHFNCVNHVFVKKRSQCLFFIYHYNKNESNKEFLELLDAYFAESVGLI